MAKARKKAPPLESKFKTRVLADLRKLPNTWAEKIQQVGICGTPDVLACINGRFVALELKRERGGKPDALQAYALGQIVRARGFAVIAYPENWPSVYAELEILAA